MTDVTYERLMSAWFVLEDLGQSELIRNWERMKLIEAKHILHRLMDVCDLEIEQKEIKDEIDHSRGARMPEKKAVLSGKGNP